jgi:hypothetical protein
MTPAEFEQMMKNDPVGRDYELADDEERFRSVGVTNGGRILSALWTVRHGKIRAVTAFKAPVIQAWTSMRFEVGAHTVNHVDLGRLAQSLQDWRLEVPTAKMVNSSLLIETLRFYLAKFLKTDCVQYFDAGAKGICVHTR